MWGSPVAAAQPTCRQFVPKLLGAQATVIGQRLGPFSSPYSGPMSLTANGDRQLSQSYGAYAGVCAGQGVDLYVDAEMVRGSGVSHASGLAAVTNGDVLRQGSVDLGDGPYIARVFARWSLELVSANRDTVARGVDDRPRIVSDRRVEMQVGKFALSDLFDLNRYANSGRTQFLNWVLFQNGSWDFAADTRGYTVGAALSWINPGWTLRAASAAMPRFANGNTFDTDGANARGDQLELTLALPRDAKLRLMAWENHARMGRYAVATAIASRTGAPPSIVGDDAPGRIKYGIGANAEIPLADSGETGAFVRAGWSDGRNESFAFTEVDRHVSAGLQLAGGRWARRDDRLAVALAIDGISDEHRAYLVAGGSGFLIGDGRLPHYGAETLVEAYYLLHVSDFIAVTPDVQCVVNPGYNRDRGPATVLTMRVRVAW